MNNPWQVESMEEFACLKCPECIFTTKEENVLQNHAVETHPLSHVFFGTPKTDSVANIVVHAYDPNDIVKDYTKENVNMLLIDKQEKSHIALVHKGKKPFKCPICNARFSQRPTWKFE